MIRIFRLTEALAALKAAQDAKAAFLEANKEDGDADAAATEARLLSAADDAEADIAALEDDNGDFVVPAFDPTESPAVKQARIDDALAALNTAITEGQSAVAKAEAAVASNTALAAALKTLDGRINALDAAEEAETLATADQAAATAKLISLTGYADVNAAVTDGALKVNADTGYYSVPNTFKVGATTTAITTPLTAAQVAAAQAAANALNTELDAQKATAAIEASKAQAELSVYLLDADVDGGATAGDIGTAKDALALEVDVDADKLTLKNVTAKYNELLGALLKAAEAQEVDVTDAAAGSVYGQKATSSALTGTELTDFNAFVDLVNDFYDAVRDEDLQLSAAVLEAKAALKIDTDALADLQELLADRAEAMADIAKLEELDTAITDAQNAFEELGLEVPVTLLDTEVATAENDLFLVAGVDVSIVNFGLEGDDLLFIGKNFTLNAGSLKDGDDAVLEVFFIQEGNNAKVVLETKAYGSSEAGVEEVTITLAGVKAADLTLTEDGFVTLA